jgi:hypothetical protein
MTKRTPLQEYRAALETFELAKLRAREKALSDYEKTFRVHTDPSLSPTERLQLFKSLQAWPRIVLGIYQAELTIAQKQKRDNPAGVHGKPSDIAYEKIAKVVCLENDRIHALCKQGRRHLREGQPQKPKISAARFREILRYQFQQKAVPQET